MGNVYNDWTNYDDSVYWNAPEDLKLILKHATYSETFKKGMALEYFVADVTSVNFGRLATVGKVAKIGKASGCNCFIEDTKVLTDVGDKILVKSEFDANGELASFL
ncbi:hypothetical protein ACFSTH_07080 [Paenibacillus yanchengensis]|uniref:Uncharacterized protein n=1 Tax=Paenibacillus yanchengensis TaxID=2035833 RepID=A0ABW4YHQ6_9BACL